MLSTMPRQSTSTASSSRGPLTTISPAAPSSPGLSSLARWRTRTLPSARASSTPRSSASSFEPLCSPRSGTPRTSSSSSSAPARSTRQSSSTAPASARTRASRAWAGTTRVPATPTGKSSAGATTGAACTPRVSGLPRRRWSCSISPRSRSSRGR
ncbi:hypothetical protein F5X68DRAFT_201135 [Plectosphaerella plurivora]|uniref:Uncharacterized protein n=1 Tax=Plectosphaerella plurivora TaxID=936078 RepID=A0A9P8VGL7_9PEZI|nr:hypothetical protein F5X68DRAFT_201135 [Plectosphaerella plurivora]